MRVLICLFLSDTVSSDIRTLLGNVEEFEKWSENHQVTSIGIFKVGKNLGMYPTMNTFEAKKDGKMFKIKYMHNCLKSSPHPAVEEFVLEQFLASTGVVETPVYLSEPLALFGCATKKTQFAGWDAERYSQCAGGVMRFQIVQLSGEAIGHDSSILGEYMQLGIQLIEGLRKIHDKGFIVGDIHRQSVRFKTQKTNNLLGTDPLVFVDLWRARYIIDTTTFGQYDSDGIDGINHAVLSPWELQSFHRQRRDDVYRAVESVADLITQGKLIDTFNGNSASIDQLIAYKSSGNVFDHDLSIPGATIYTDAYARFKDVAPANKARAEHILKEMTKNILKLRIDEKPNYDAVIQAFNNVLALTKSPTASVMSQVSKYSTRLFADAESSHTDT